MRLLQLIVVVLLLIPTNINAGLPGDYNDIAGRIKLAMPPIVYAIAGIESNVYFDNVVLVLNPSNYAFDVNCAKGIQQVERWTYTPTAKDKGDHLLILEVRDENNLVIARGHSIIRVVPREIGAGKNVSLLMIGDSLTQAGVYPRRVYDLSGEPNNPQLTLIGARVPKVDPGQVRFEGYGGWTAQRFVTFYNGKAHFGNYRDLGSPFIYKEQNAEPRLDFVKYFAQFNKSKSPDFVTILLGCNDVINSTEANLESSIDDILRYYDQLLTAIHAVDKNIKIGVVLPVPPAGTQDAFGANYKSGRTRLQYKRNQHRLVERMLVKYGGMERERIIIVPAYVNLDAIGGFPKEIKDGHERLINGVHPSPQGYNQIGDSIYCWLKAQF